MSSLDVMVLRVKSGSVVIVVSSWASDGVNWWGKNGSTSWKGELNSRWTGVLTTSIVSGTWRRSSSGGEASGGAILEQCALTEAVAWAVLVESAVRSGRSQDDAEKAASKTRGWTAVVRSMFCRS